MTSLPTLLTTTEAALKLGVQPVTIRRWVRKGLLEAVVLPSGRLRFEESTVLRARSQRGGWAA